MALKDVYPITEEFIDLAKYTGLSLSVLSPAEIIKRKISIDKKVDSVRRVKMHCSPFTIAEEFDIHCRASIYVENTIPDPQFYSGFNKAQSSERIKKRGKLLEQGTGGLKPKATLIQLVSEAVCRSPDSMLQVGQVYMVLQKKYPYFQHLKRSPLLSWKSSVRHALYQKWFCKVTFMSECISCNGNYWAYIPDSHSNQPGSPAAESLIQPVEQPFRKTTNEEDMSDLDITLNRIQSEVYPESTESVSDSCSSHSPNQVEGNSPFIPHMTQWYPAEDGLDPDDENLVSDGVIITTYDSRMFDVKGSLDTTLNELNAVSQSTESGEDVFDLHKDERFSSQTSSDSDKYWLPYRVEISTDHSLFDLLPSYPDEPAIGLDVCRAPASEPSSAQTGTYDLELGTVQGRLFN